MAPCRGEVGQLCDPSVKAQAFHHDLMHAANGRDLKKFPGPLIHIKTGRNPSINLSCKEAMGFVMPTETAIVVAGVVCIFAFFAAALAWVDYYSRGVRTPGAQYFDEAK
jgi:hypothetical protein